MKKIMIRVITLMFILCVAAFAAGCGSGGGSSSDDSSDSGSFSDLRSFTAATLDGGEFTQDDLAAADLTVIYCWQSG